MNEKDVERINKNYRLIDAGAISELFENTIQSVAKLAVDERMEKLIHDVINPMLDDMIRQLHSMKNNVIATMIGKDDTPIKVIRYINESEEEEE